MSQMKCRERSGQLTIGLITSGIKTAIQATTLAENGLKTVYGFGSFFRFEPFRDIDILAVVKDGTTTALKNYYTLRSALEAATEHLEAPIHLTMLTDIEFRSKPLKCMNELIILWNHET